MDVSTEKSKIMMSRLNETRPDITVICKKLDEVTSLKFLGATLSENGTNTANVRIRIAVGTATIARLSKLWKRSCISFPTKHRLYKSRVVSI